MSVRARALQALHLGGHVFVVLPKSGFHWVAQDDEHPRSARWQLLALQMDSHAESVVQLRPHGSEFLSRLALLGMLARHLIAWQILHKAGGKAQPI